jgi:Flp pilus assembly protein TadG
MLLKRFGKNNGGNFAAATALVALPLLLSIGLSVDYSRYVSAGAHLQEMADSAALALASSRETDKDKLKVMAGQWLDSNWSGDRVDNVEIASLTSENDRIDLLLNGTIPTTFMGLANIRTLKVGASALAMRAVTGTVEVALVLDNTYSMAGTDAKGVSRITTLKKAAKALVSELMSNKDASVRIGLVPYADYVNVGTKHRDAAWLDLPKDYTTAAVAATCKWDWVPSKTCTKRAPNYSCPTYVDGIMKPRTCTGACLEEKTNPSVWKEVCSGGKSAQTYKWFGCVGSRRTADNRLHDKNAAVKYPGYVDVKQLCLNPLVALTNDQDALLKALDGMVINIGSYEPYTYIPSGLIWGQNLLSPSEPFAEAAAYDKKNVDPRKVMVLMTDGDNTLQFRASDGKHIALSGSEASKANQVKKTNEDSAEICAYMKSNDIEIFTVAFMVTNAAAKALLQGCATDAEHYYDASDPDKLLAAFSGIAQSLSQVRLAR